LRISGGPRRKLLPSGKGEEIVPAGYREPFIDVIETDKEIIASAELPGLEKQDININVTEDRLEISAQTKHEEKKEEKGYVYRERRSGSYYRAISLPSPVDPDGSKPHIRTACLK